MRARAFSPCHITGFFDVSLHEDPLKSGSAGAGIVLDRGVTTEVRAEEAERQEVEVFTGSSPCRCNVTEEVVRSLLGSARYRVEVIHELEMPMMQGFGVSGAGALSTALALNQALGLGYTAEKLGRIAHRAEVLNLTGLGDVIAELSGGFLIRKSPGAPGIGEVLKLDCDGKVFCFVVDEALGTKRVLSERGARERLNSSGKQCLKSLLASPSLENFLSLSRSFARSSGLLSSRVKAAMEVLEAKNIASSMCMLGGSVFTFSREAEGLRDWRCIMANISSEGARVL